MFIVQIVKSSRKSNVSSVEFEHDRDGKQQVLLTKKTVTGEIHVKSMLREVFDFAQRHELATNALG